MDYKKITVNTEVKISEGKFSAVTITFNPTKKEYSWILFFEKEEELHPVKPNKITGQVRTWKTKSAAASNLKAAIKKLN